MAMLMKFISILVVAIVVINSVNGCPIMKTSTSDYRKVFTFKEVLFIWVVMTVSMICAAIFSCMLFFLGMKVCILTDLFTNCVDRYRYQIYDFEDYFDDFVGECGEIKREYLGRFYRLFKKHNAIQPKESVGSVYTISQFVE